MLGFEMAMLDAVAHTTLSLSPPGIERSITAFVSEDVKSAAERDLKDGKARLEEVVSSGRRLRAEINALKGEAGAEALPLLDQAIAVGDKRLRERSRFFDRERKLVPRYRKFIASHFPGQLELYDSLEPRWRDLRVREHEEIVDFLCFLRAVRGEIDEDGRTVVATFKDAGAWRKHASRLVN